MTNIIATVVPVEQRLNITALKFKHHFPFKIEPAIYHMARILSSGYQGAYWEFMQLSNNGFYMSPDIDEPVRIVCENGYEGQVSKDAFGIIACLYVYSNLSFSDNNNLALACAEHFHWLREFALNHAEGAAILEAID